MTVSLPTPTGEDAAREPGIRVLVGQSFFLRLDPKSLEGSQAYPPLGSLIAAACLREQGADVRVFDAMLADSVDDWAAALDRHRPDIAVLYEDNFNYLSKMCLLNMREAAFRMIAAARERACTVLVCGSDATDRAEEYLDQGAHFILVGEGEATLLELFDQLTGPDRNSHRVEDDPIEGLVMRGAAGELVRTPPRPVLRDLDALPLPARDLIDLEPYRALWKERHGSFSLNIAATRGCPYHCNWCAKPIWGQTYHMRSPASVADEIASLRNETGPDELWFADDILGLKKGWLGKLADELETRDARIPFKCQSRVDLLLRPGEIDDLARAGCRIVWVGAESGSQKILDAMDKGTRVEQIREATQKLHEAGVAVGFFLQFGYPGEEMDDVERTLEMVRSCRPDEIGMSVSYALPGTRFYESVRDQLGNKQNWVDSQDLDMMYRGRFTTDFYRQLYTVLHREFRMRRTFRELRTDALAALRPHGVLQLGKAIAQGVLLPLDRRKLRALSQIPNDGLSAIEGTMSPEAAAQPSPQAPSATGARE